MPSLEEQIKDIFIRKSLSLATAESCTGGLLSGRITNVPGSSAYFYGGVVSYSNASKQSLLGVPAMALETFGAVSEEVARQMAFCTRRRLGTDVAISITGVAGPDGGTDERPVGLVWIGLCDEEGHYARRYVWDSDRVGNRERTVLAALALLIHWGNKQDNK